MSDLEQADCRHENSPPSSRSYRPVCLRRLCYPPEVIVLAVRWYLRFALSYCDVEELLAERGIDVDHVTVYRWVQRFTHVFNASAQLRFPLAGVLGAR